MYMKKFIHTVSNQRYSPVIKISFYDNPYLLKNKDQFDIYTLTVPFHIYLKDSKNKVSVYTMNKNLVEYNKNKDLIYECIDKYSNQMNTLLNNFTVNNQNITPIKSSLCWNTETFKYINKNILPAYVFPKQQNNNKTKINYNPMYEIRTLIKLNKDENSVNNIWNKVAEYYD